MEISFTIKQFGQIDFCEQKLAQWLQGWLEIFSNLVEFIAIDAYLEEELENLKEILKGIKLWKYNILD